MLADEHAAVTLSAIAYQAAWRALGLAPMPLVLHVADGVPDDRAGIEELEHRGLAEDGKPGDWLVRVLSTLADVCAALDVRAGTGRGAVRGIGAARCGTAVLAWLSAGVLTLREVTEDGLAAAVAGLLPPWPAGTGRAVTRPGPDLATDLLPDGFTDTVLLAQFGATVRDAHGRRRRSPRVATVHDTAEGRFLAWSTGYPGGDEWTTIEPAGPARLEHHVQVLLDELRGDGVCERPH